MKALEDIFGGTTSAPPDVESLIDLYTEEYGVNPALIRNQIGLESGGNESAVSAANAGGLMQIIPSTAEGIATELGEEYSDNKRFDPQTNLRWGIYHMSTLIDEFDGDEQLALAAYLAGPSRIKKMKERGETLDSIKDKYTGMSARQYSENILSGTGITPSAKRKSLEEIFAKTRRPLEDIFGKQVGYTPPDFEEQIETAGGPPLRPDEPGEVPRAIQEGAETALAQQTPPAQPPPIDVEPVDEHPVVKINRAIDFVLKPLEEAGRAVIAPVAGLATFLGTVQGQIASGADLASEEAVEARGEIFEQEKVESAVFDFINENEETIELAALAGMMLYGAAPKDLSKVKASQVIQGIKDLPLKAKTALQVQGTKIANVFSRPELRKLTKNERASVLARAIWEDRMAASPNLNLPKPQMSAELEKTIYETEAKGAALLGKEVIPTGRRVMKFGLGDLFKRKPPPAPTGTPQISGPAPVAKQKPGVEIVEEGGVKSPILEGRQGNIDRMVQAGRKQEVDKTRKLFPSKVVAPESQEVVGLGDGTAIQAFVPKKPHVPSKEELATLPQPTEAEAKIIQAKKPEDLTPAEKEFVATVKPPKAAKPTPKPKVEEKPEFHYETTVLKKPFSGAKNEKPVFTEKFNALSNPEKHKILTAEKKLIDKELKAKEELNTIVGVAPLKGLKRRLDNIQRKISTAGAVKSGREAKQIDKYAESGKPHTKLTEQIQGDIETVFKEFENKDITDLNNLLKGNYSEKTLKTAVNAIKKGQKDGKAAQDIRKEIGEYLGSGTHPDQVVDLATEKGVDKATDFPFGENVKFKEETADMFEGKLPKSTKTQMDIKAEKKKRAAKGGKADTEGLPAFEGGAGRVGGAEQQDVFAGKKKDMSQAGAFRLPTMDFTTKKQKVPEAARKIHEEWSSQKQLKLFESSKEINDVKIALPKMKDREVIPFLMERTGVPSQLGRPDLEALIKDPARKQELTKVAEKAKKHFKKSWDYMQEHIKDFDAQEIENYVTHIWDIPKSKVRGAVNWFATRNPFLKKRFIDTYKKGIELGYKPKTLDIAEIMNIHDQYVIKTTENIKLIEGLKKLQDESGTNLILRSDKAPDDWIVSDHPILKRAMVVGMAKVTVPVKTFNTTIIESIDKIRTIEKSVAGGAVDVSKPIKKLEQVMGHALEMRGMTPGESKAYMARLKSAYAGKEVGEVGEKVTETQQKDIKKIIREVEGKFPVDVPIFQKVPVKYHPDLDPLMKSVFGKRFQSTPLQIYEAVNAGLKQTQLGFSLFHHAALIETGVATIGPVQTAKIFANARAMWRALKHNRYDVYEEKFEVAKDGIKHGLQVGAITDVQRGLLNDALKNVEDYLNRVHKNLGLPVKGLRKGKDLWDKALWDYLHNNLKVYGYESLVTKELARGKNLTAGQITDIKKEVAQFVNDTFGGQNWEGMMTDPKNLQMAQWVLLSPDWTLSTIRQALSVTGIGKATEGGGKTRRRMGLSFAAKALFYFGGGVNLLNYMFSKYDNAKQRGVPFLKGDGVTMVENDPGHKTHLFVGRYPDGTKRYIRWGKQFREGPELIYDQTAGQISPVTAVIHKAGGKAAPAMQLISTIFTRTSLGGFRNKELADKVGWSWVGAATKEILKTPLPFAFKNTLNETKQFKLTDLAFPSSKGMSYYKGKKLFKLAITKQKIKYVENVYKALIENNIAADEVWKDAITEMKREAAAEIGKDIRLGKITEPATLEEFKGMSREQKRELSRKAQLESWEVLIKAVDERYNAFLLERDIMKKKLIKKGE